MSTHEESAKWCENIESELTTLKVGDTESLALLVMHEENLARFKEIAASLRDLASEEPIPKSELEVGAEYLCWEKYRNQHVVYVWRTPYHGEKFRWIRRDMHYDIVEHIDRVIPIRKLNPPKGAKEDR